MQIIDGKATAAQIKAEIAEEVKNIVAQGGKQPHLAAILVGHDGGSETYMKNKVLACEACGFKSSLIRFDEDVTEEELLKCVEKLNNDDDVDGYIIQLPLPKHIDEQKIIMAVDYRKDVDGFHPINVGRMSIGLPCISTKCRPGGAELLIKDGINGLLVNTDDVDSMHEALQKMTDASFADALGQEAGKVRDSFSEETIASLWCDYLGYLVIGRKLTAE